VASNVGGFSEPIAEHAMAMVLALLKRLPQRHAEMARGEFHHFAFSRTLDGAVCGVLGYGGIGRAVAGLMRPFGARIHAVNTSGRTDDPAEFVGTLDDLPRVLEASDVLVIALPLTERTRGLIGRDELARMKPECVLINVARGAIVDQDALFARLQAFPEFSAGLDVWWDEPLQGGPFRVDHPFLELPNVVATPHNSAFVPGSLEEATGHAARNVRRYFMGEEPAGLVRREDYG
jgi:phosphoglycerate dehydrogenase-like enzyme